MVLALGISLIATGKLNPSTVVLEVSLFAPDLISIVRDKSSLNTSSGRLEYTERMGSELMKLI